MYTVAVSVKGIAPLMQHKFPVPDLETMSKGATRSTGAKDYTKEFLEYFYTLPSGQIYQPSSHFEGAMIKAATNFKITGKGRKTYKDLFQANVFVTPEKILHEGFFVTEDLDTDGDKPLYLDVRPVVIQRSRIVRIRPTFSPGWELKFEIEVIDDEIQPNLLQDVLALSGKTVGIGDYRPRFGRFNVIRFEVNK